MATYIDYYNQVAALHDTESSGNSTNATDVAEAKRMAAEAKAAAAQAEDSARYATGEAFAAQGQFAHLSSLLNETKGELAGKIAELGINLDKITPEFIQVTSDMLHIDNGYPYSKQKILFSKRYSKPPYVVPILKFNSAIAAGRTANVYEVDNTGCFVRVNFKTLRPQTVSGETIDLYLMVVVAP